MKITVKVLEDDREILSKVLTEGVYRVGRSEFSDIVLPSESVSRSHLEIRVTEAAVYMTNMSGPGKVKLNGKTIETAEISGGDTLNVGSYRILVQLGEEEQAVSEPPLEQAPAVENNFDALNESPDAESPREALPQAAPDDAAFEPPLEKMASSPSFSSEGNAALRSETVIEMKPVVAKLIFMEGPRGGEELFLETYEVSIGRSKKADIYLDDEKLSRIHAKITRVGMGYRLIDLNSRNGTYVNGVRVLEHPLSSFDSIEIGNTKIRFLIHDVVSSNVEKGALEAVGQQTRSLQLGAENPPGIMLEFKPPQSGGLSLADNTENEKKRAKTIRMLAAALIAAVIIFILIPSGPKKTPRTTPEANNPASATKSATNAQVHTPPLLSKEFMELTPQMQRTIEGYYNTALRAADKEMYGDAVASLRKIHEVIPYYKQSKDLLDQYSKRLKEKQIQEAAEKAKKDEKQELSLYLEDGIEYLKQGDYDRAAEAFNSAIVIDPNNKTAIKGLKAAELRIRNIEQVPPERDPEKEKLKMVQDLFKKAVEAFANKSYQEAIETAEKIRQIELKGDTHYLNEAKQIIDKSRLIQKEEFEPFIIQAKEKYAEGDYNASRDLCEEMLKRDPAYDEAKECVLKAKKQLNRLAKEAYTHGYILESMNRIEEAKQYWNRAKNYVRSGDEYYDKVQKKLDYYQ